MSNSTPKCLFCNIILVTRDKRQKFCNLSCSASYNNSKVPKRKAETISLCEECKNSIFLKKKPKGGYYSREYCDACLRLKKIYNISAADGPEDFLENQTKGSLYNRRKNWQSANSTIRKHSRKIYMNANAPKFCKACQYDKYIEICHIKQVKDFADDVSILEINSLTNLVALCPNHHWEFDNRILII